MLRTIMITGTAICLSLGSSLALADHDRTLRYAVGGAILGAALSELTYASDYYPAHGYTVVDYGYRRGYAYAPPRLYRHGRVRSFHRHWRSHDRFRHPHRRGHGRWHR